MATLKRIAVTLFILAAASQVWIHCQDHSETNIIGYLWGSDVRQYRHAVQGDPDWWPDDWTRLRIERIPFCYSDNHLWLMKPWVWFSESTTITLVFFINVLSYLYIAWRLCDAPHGWAVAIIGAKCMQFYLWGGNVAPLAAALSLGAMGGSLGAVLKPYGLGLVWIRAARWAHGDRAAKALVQRQSPLVLRSLRGRILQALAVYTALAAFSWFYWLSPQTREMILTIFRVTL